MFKYFHITILSWAVFLKPLSAEEIKRWPLSRIL